MVENTLIDGAAGSGITIAFDAAADEYPLTKGINIIVFSNTPGTDCLALYDDVTPVVRPPPGADGGNGSLPSERVATGSVPAVSRIAVETDIRRMRSTAVFVVLLFAFAGCSGNPDTPSQSEAGTRGFWDAMATLDSPSPRYGHTAVWTGSEMIVWGGLDVSGSPMATGGAYDPVMDSWRAVTTTGAPEARSAHTAVWTGSEMVVWGGRGASAFLDSGAAYDPVADAWRALATAGSPTARGLHTAVWTGISMLVWGGQGDFPPGPVPNSVYPVFGDGAAYDPALDTWSPISTQASPAGRDQHTAVWTRDEMIIWGGLDGFALTLSPIQSGGVYDPETDTWVATTTLDAPQPRAGDLGVATGAGGPMVVWGGRGRNPQGVPAGLDTGSRYEPSTDTWFGMTGDNAATARHDHTAIWVETEVVIWGGVGLHDRLSSGAAYDPVADSWRETSTQEAPVGRSHHTAVWTGTQMIIWGGIPATGARPASLLNTGGVYTP